MPGYFLQPAATDTRPRKTVIVLTGFDGTGEELYFQTGCAALERGWNVLLAPIGTPDTIIRKASADLRKALDNAELATKLAAMGAFLHPMTPEEVTAFAQEQQRTWRPVAEKVAAEATEAK